MRLNLNSIPRAFGGNVKPGAGVASVFTTLLLAAVALHARQEPTFSTAVNVVNILATVADKKGHIVHDLHKEDFLLTEDGQPQTIRYFATQSDLPLNLGILIDSSMSQERVMTLERSACFRFLDQVLRPNRDKVFLLQFDI